MKKIKKFLTLFFLLSCSFALIAKDKKEDDRSIQIAKGWVGFLKLPKAHPVKASEDLSKRKSVIWEEWQGQKDQDILTWLPKPDKQYKAVKQSPWPPIVVHKEEESHSRKTRSRNK